MSMKHIKTWLVMAAGLLLGCPAVAQEVPQPEPVRFAVSMEVKSGDTWTEDTAPQEGDTVRLRVAVSVPRTNDKAPPVTLSAMPVRLMCRPHGGTGTAFDGSLRLSPLYPAGPLAFYPMPQKFPVDRSPVARFEAMSPAQKANLLPGRAHSPARWERVYVTDARIFSAASADTSVADALIHSLAEGLATHEWYAASRHGLGSFLRISDIQDAGRCLSLRDADAWVEAPTATADSDKFPHIVPSGNPETDIVSAEAFAALGSATHLRSRIMPDATNAWEIRHGAIGTTLAGTGLHLLNVAKSEASASERAMLVSPQYPDGISAIEFEARASQSGTYPQELDVQIYVPETPGTATRVWKTVKTLPLTTAMAPQKVDIDGRAVDTSYTRFRIVRRTAHDDIGGDPSTLTLVIRDIRVRSAAPRAIFGKPRITSELEGAPVFPMNRSEVINIEFEAKHVDGTPVPNGYSGTLRMRRRAHGDSNNAWQKLPLSTPSTGSAALAGQLRARALVTNFDGTVNAKEGAFFLENGIVDGVMPGVYDLALDYGVLGAYKAGREQIEERESITDTVDSEPVNPAVEAEGRRPFVLEVRETKTEQQNVALEVTYRTGTGTDLLPYVFHTLTVPCRPVPGTENVWSAAIPKVCHPEQFGELKDENAEFAWGYNTYPTSADEGNLEKAIGVQVAGGEHVMAFRVKTDFIGPKGRAFFGQKGSVTPRILPEVRGPEPSQQMEMMRHPTADETQPVVIALDGLSTSHLRVTVDFSKSDITPMLAIGGAFYQDFNDWSNSAPGFSAMEYRGSTTAYTADFNAEMDPKNPGAKLGGWFPDEGPLAENSTLRDSFRVAHMRQAVGTETFSLPTFSYQGAEYFAMWGASPLRASPHYLRADHSNLGYNTDGMTLSRGTEVVLRRESTETSAGRLWLPDASIRLRETQTLTPRDRSADGVELQGLGTVSFRLRQSYPFNILSIARIHKNDDFGSVYAAGGSTVVDMLETTYEAGRSVSVFLVNDFAKFELRVTEVLKFGEKSDEEARERPKAAYIYEIYKWTSTSNPTRLGLRVGGRDVPFYETADTFVNRRIGLWLRSDGHLAFGVCAGSQANPALLGTTSASIGTADRFTLALGSAECRPVFSRLSVIADPVPETPTAWSELAKSKHRLFVSDESPTWQYANAAGASGSIALTRAEKRSAVVLEAIDENGNAVRQRVVKTENERVSVSLGAANAKLRITPQYSSDSVFIDDVAITAWCGNDIVRNGDDYVPFHTDEGYNEEGSVGHNGFAGVGLWITPEPSQMNIDRRYYTGEQCLLMQRSRQNRSVTSPGEDLAIDGIHTTGAALALYTPYSNRGFGPVSFRYRIPASDEFSGDGRPMSSVKVMLQFRKSASPRNDWLGNGAGKSWQNVSKVIELPNTAGAWATAGITPILEGKELVAGRDTSGNLRLVMVVEGLSAQADPYLYIDDFVVTDNRTGVVSSWTAANARVSDTPPERMYWGDRLANPAAVPAEKDFADRAKLSPSMELNDVTHGSDTDGQQDVTNITSPELLHGVGCISFAVRRSDPNPVPARVYIQTSEKDKGEDFVTVTYVNVPNTVYTSYRLDLAEIPYLKWIPEEDRGPDGNDHQDDLPFANEKVRRVRLMTYPDGDGNNQDDYGKAVVHARLRIDTLSVDNPVTPRLSIGTVMFSNQPGSGLDGFIQQRDARLAGHMSPLSQPIAKPATLRALVYAPDRQKVKEGTVRMFITYRRASVAPSNGLLEKDTNGTYTDVMGAPVQASNDSPIYAWNSTKLDDWSAQSWFTPQYADLRNLVAGTADETTLRTELAKRNTFELKAIPGEPNYFEGPLTATGGYTAALEALPNDMLQYMVWAVYESDDDKLAGKVFHSEITYDDYTEYPWYFPRNFNAEMFARCNTDKDHPLSERDCFSPYVWIYSTRPGEVFLNEFDMRDSTSPNFHLAKFVEICTPAERDIRGWRLRVTRNSTTDDCDDIPLFSNLTDEEPIQAAIPADGVVPDRRGTGTNAGRTFVYLSDPGTKLHLDPAQPDMPALGPLNNAGLVGTSMSNSSYGGGNAASSVMLLRPTGGADHIVCYSRIESESLSDTARENLDGLYNRYLEAYRARRFGAEWFQEFFNDTWEDEETKRVDRYSAKEHGQRLVKIEKYRVKDGRYDAAGNSLKDATDYTTDAVVSSFATVDMGGVWVGRINKNDDAKAVNISHLADGVPQNTNYTTTTRPDDPLNEVQVTPRQVNPDQYLFRFVSETLTLSSELVGTAGYGYPVIRTYGDVNDPIEAASHVYRPGVRSAKVTQGLLPSDKKVILTYTPLAYNRIASLSLKLLGSKDHLPIVDAERLKACVKLPAGITLGTPDDKGTVPLVFASEDLRSEPVDITLIIAAETDGFNTQAKVAFDINEEDPGLARVFRGMRPFCGDSLPGYAKYQPWWGSNFGFEVLCNVSDDPQKADLSPVSVLVTYPSPALVKPDAILPMDTADVSADWAGTTFLQGDYETARTKLGTEEVRARTAFTELKQSQMLPGNVRRFAAVSGFGLVGDAYARAAGYDPAKPATAACKEPPVPFCVWGVYRTFVPADRGGSQEVSYIIRQKNLADCAALPGEPVFAEPEWYRPAGGLSNGTHTPYFYLYSAPAQSVWLNEVNLNRGSSIPGEGSDPFAEVVFPVLRDGLVKPVPPATDAKLPQVTSGGWSVARYSATGAGAGVFPLPDGPVTRLGYAPYGYAVAPVDGLNAPGDTAAYVLRRPCGAADGGVWTGVQTRAAGEPELEVVLPGTPDWLVDGKSFIMKGQRDATDRVGSVQLTGETVSLAGRGGYIVTDISKHTQWTFSATETKGRDNENVLVDADPYWDRIAIASILRNDVFPGSPCATQILGAYFEQGDRGGVSATLENEMSAEAWVWKSDETFGNFYSYRPRVGYRFTSISYPADLEGRVMFIGYPAGEMNRARFRAAVDQRMKLAKTNPEVLWNLTGIPGDFNYATKDPVTAGRVSFHPNSGASVKDDLTLTDSYVIAAVIVGEPFSARNEFIMSFGQDAIRRGQWLVSQTLFAMKNVAGENEPAKWLPDNGDDKGGNARGGTTVTYPIWSDENGDAHTDSTGAAATEGAYRNLHGWAYQPIVGDRIGMSAVLSPADGLFDTAGSKTVDLVRSDATLRPFLVWTRIPKHKVPADLFRDVTPQKSSMLIENWGVDQWIGGANGVPSYTEGRVLSFDELRRRLKAGASDTSSAALYDAAGIIPMVYRGWGKQSAVSEKAMDLVPRSDTDADTLAGEQIPLLAYTTVGSVDPTLTGTALDSALAADSTLLQQLNDRIGSSDDAIGFSDVIDLQKADTGWADGSILRFAIVIADVETGRVYDCQSVSNFTSAAFEGYCPWYVPAETSDVNYVSRIVKNTVSPYAWVYGIEQDGVWINEFRALAENDTSAGVELAMLPSAIDPEKEAAGKYVAERSLDGWKLIFRYAPLPLADSAEPIRWVSSNDPEVEADRNHPLHGRTVELKGWVPAKRLALSDPTDPNVERLDYYTVVRDETALSASQLITYVPFDPADPNTREVFTYLTFPTDAGVPGLPEPEHRFAKGLIDPALDEALRTGEQADIYRDGVVFAVALVRNNGVLSDEVLFYVDSVGLEPQMQIERMHHAADLENSTHAVANTVRAVAESSVRPSPKGAPRGETAAYYRRLDTNTVFWHKHDGDGISSMAGPNITEMFGISLTQPRAVYDVPGFASTFGIFSARILGAPATLNLAADGHLPTQGKAMAVVLRRGSGYTLTVRDWDARWFALASVSCNGEDVTPERPAAVRTYALDASGTLAATDSLEIGAGKIAGDTDYAVRFVYTPEANALEQSGALESADDGFLDWLTRVDPDAILKSTAADGVSASEKYWLGLDSALVDASEIKLAITELGFQTEPDATVLPSVRVAFTHAGTPIGKLRGDGVIVLLGATEMNGEWQYLTRLQPTDMNGDNVLILPTDCRFFKALLLSEKQESTLKK